MQVPLHPDNVWMVYDSPSSILRVALPQLFARLRRPDENKYFIEQFAGCLEQHWQRQIFMRNDEARGWDTLQTACVEAGIVETFTSLTKNTRADLAVISYKSFYVISHLARLATVAERRKLSDECIKHGVLEICLDKAKNHHLCLHRYLGLSTMRVLCAQLFVGDTLSPEKAAEVIELLCDLALEGSDRVADELADPEYTWQSKMMLGRTGLSANVASRYGRRWYEMANEASMFAVHGILVQYPARPRQFYLDVIKAKPKIIDLLLDVAATPRPPWYPETQADSLASESLGLLFQFYLRGVPGFEFPVEGQEQQERANEFGTVVEGYKILVSRPGWASRCLAVLKRQETETYGVIDRMRTRVTSDYYATIPPDVSRMHQIWVYRGQSKCSILRLISGATYADNASTADLLSLLRTAYDASRKLKSAENGVLNNMEEACEYTARMQEVWRRPLWAMETDTFTMDATAQTPPTILMGPIALIRLLIALARRGVLEEAQQWTTLPDGCSPGTNLKAVKQLMSPAIIKAIIPFAMNRIKIMHERGNDQVKKQQTYYARSNYIPCAELATALIELNNLNQGRWTEVMQGAHKELVLCLSNAAEMSLRKNEWRTGIGFALAANKAAELAPSSEGITSDTIAKNQRRIDNARKNCTTA